MKIEWIYVIIFALAITAVSGCTTSSPAVTPTATVVPSAATPTPTAAPSPSIVPSAASISIAGFSFQPGEVTIAKGGTVTWTNDDGTAHTVKFADSESSALQKGSTYSKKFDSAGTFDYGCGIHPSMKGKVIVT